MVRVITRIHDGNSSGHSQNPRYFYEAKDSNQITLYKSNVRTGGRCFFTDTIYDQCCSNHDLYESEISNSTRGALEGRDSTIVLLGSPDSGKQYTLEGLSETNGIWHEILHSLFSGERYVGKEYYYQIFLSYYIIDKEQLKDAMSNCGSKIMSNQNVRFRDDDIKGVIAENLTKVQIFSIDHAHDIYSAIKRSILLPPEAHSVLSITVKQSTVLGISDKNKTVSGTINIVSVGIVKPTNRTNNSSAYLNQEAHLDTQLRWFHTLMQCLNCLESKNSAIVQFHKSKFTMMLRDCLTGRRECVLINTLSPTDESYDYAISNLTICHRIKQVSDLNKLSSSKSRKAIPFRKDYIHQQYHFVKQKSVSTNNNTSATYLKESNRGFHEIHKDFTASNDKNIIDPDINKDTLYMTAEEFKEYVKQKPSYREHNPQVTGRYRPISSKVTDSTTHDINDYNERYQSTENMDESAELAFKESKLQPNIYSGPQQVESLDNSSDDIDRLRIENKLLAEKILELENQLSLLIEERLMLQTQYQEQTRTVVEESSPPRSDTQTSQSFRSSDKLIRYNEVMEAAILRMKGDMAKLETENNNLKRDLQKRDSKLLKLQNLIRYIPREDSSQYKKQLNQYEEKISRLQNLLKKKKNEEMAWRSSKRNLEKQIRILNQENSELKRKMSHIYQPIDASTSTIKFDQNRSVDPSDHIQFIYEAKVPTTYEGDFKSNDDTVNREILHRKENGNPKNVCSTYDDQVYPSPRNDMEGNTCDSSIEIEECDMPIKTTKFKQKESEALRRAIYLTFNGKESLESPTTVKKPRVYQISTPVATITHLCGTPTCSL